MGLSQPSHGSAGFSDGIYDGKSLETVNLSSALQWIQPGTAVVISEDHSAKAHQRNQQQLLEELARSKPELKISVGMEFIDYVAQPLLDRFLADPTADAEKRFLFASDWRGDFSVYRSQVLFPLNHHGKTIGLNAPGWLTRRVVRVGIEGLNVLEKNFLPPEFNLGNELYRERVLKFADHLPSSMADDFFASQSVWDDTMAWQAASYLRANPDQVLVIIVGDMHVAYGGGLPDRLRARGINKVVVFSQVNKDGMSSEQIRSEVEPHPRYGVRADWVWVSGSGS